MGYNINMRPYPEPDNSYQHAVTEQLNTALTNIVYYYHYVKENYVDPAVERVFDMSFPQLTLWQYTPRLPYLIRHPENSPPAEVEHDYVDWASLDDNDQEKLMHSIEMASKNRK